jgi:hypothetical protein
MRIVVTRIQNRKGQLFQVGAPLRVSSLASTAHKHVRFRHTPSCGRLGKVRFWRTLSPPATPTLMNLIQTFCTVCCTSGYEPLDHFRDITKMVDVCSGAITLDIPEKLPAAEDVKKVERRLMSE